jgi:hypothetical protein
MKQFNFNAGAHFALTPTTRYGTTCAMSTGCTN